VPVAAPRLVNIRVKRGIFTKQKDRTKNDATYKRRYSRITMERESIMKTSPMLCRFSIFSLIFLTLDFSPGSNARAAVYPNGTATATFTVTLAIQGACTVSANALNFGTTGVLGTLVNQSTTLSVICSNTTPYNVGLDAGTVSGSTVSARLLAGTATGNTSTTISFQLYQDAGHTTIWGNTQSTDTVAGTGNGTTQPISVYGQVPVQSTPKPDTYQTTITATVYF
jgi:spore coat protein U-like protein